MSSSEKSPATPENNGVLRWIILAAVVIVGFWLGIKALREAPEVGSGGAASGGAPAGPPPATVLIRPVLLQSSQQTRKITGSLRAVSRAQVAAREAGAVEDVLVDEGQTVKQNEILATLDPRRLDAELAEATARVTATKSIGTQRQAEAKRATTDFERKQKLYETGAVSEREFLDAESAKAVAVAAATTAANELTAVTSAVELLNVRRGDLNVRAPFAGRVVKRHVEAGEWLTAGSPVVTLTSSGEIEAWLNVPERFISSITDLNDELFLASDSTGLKAKVKSLQTVADIDPKTRLFDVVATVDDLDGKLAPGMAVEIDLPVGEKKQRLAIPVDAMVIEREQAYVFRPASPQGDQPAGPMPSAEKIKVTELFRGGGLVFVESDSLRAGDLVVTEGNERLMPGTSLIIPAAIEDGESAEESAAQPAQ